MRLRPCRISLVVAMALVLLAPSARAAPKDPDVVAGDYLQLLLPITAWGLTYGYHDPEGREQFYWSYFTTLGISYALKAKKKEPRPNSNNTQSYVSAHTASAFAGAAFMQMRYGWGWGLPAYAAAIYTAESRVDDENPSHYQADVNRGALIALITTAIFTSRYQSAGRRVAPVIAPGYTGLAMEMDW